jgi:hypothetical protein
MSRPYQTRHGRQPATRGDMRRILLAALLLFAAACTPAENEGGTPLPDQGSGAPLNDEAIGPSEDPAEIEP